MARTRIGRAPVPTRAMEAPMKCFVAFLTAAVLLQPGAAPAQTVTLKLATIVGNDNPFTTSAMKFKEVAEAKSGGRIKVEVYPVGGPACRRDPAAEPPAGR